MLLIESNRRKYCDGEYSMNHRDGVLRVVMSVEAGDDGSSVLKMD
jgi:hypothetical protein